MHRVFLLVLVGALALPLPAAGATPRPRTVDWVDRTHAWAPCDAVVAVPAETDLCSTENGGKTWHLIFECCNYVFGFARTSAGSGVVESGYRGASTFWTRTNGRRWYTLPNIPAQDFFKGARAYVFAGRGSRLFWAHEGTINQITGWPATTDPPCHPDPSNSTYCVLRPDESPFQSHEVAAAARGWIESMRIVPGGVAALIGPGLPYAPLSLLVYRNGGATTTTLPEAPVEDQLAPIAFAAAWPRLFVERAAYDDNGANRADILWWSADGGKSWRVQAARVVPRHANATATGRAGRRVDVPGGWVAAGLGAPTRIVSHVGHLHARRLPFSRGCDRLTSLIVAWPVLYATSERASWWSSDGGATWAAAGRC